MEAQGLDPQLVAAIVGGVIGIVGSIATLIASHFLRVAGRITVTLSEAKIRLRKIENHTEVEVHSVADALTLNAELEVDIHNSSDIPRSLRELQIESRSRAKRKTVKSNVFVDVRASAGSGRYSFPKELPIINIAPKELQHLSFRFHLTKEQLNLVDDKLEFYFTALHPNGRKFKVFLLRSGWGVPRAEP
jgi:hypothetical protein